MARVGSLFFLSESRETWQLQMNQRISGGRTGSSFCLEYHKIPRPKTRVDLVDPLGRLHGELMGHGILKTEPWSLDDSLILIIGSLRYQGLHSMFHRSQIPCFTSRVPSRIRNPYMPPEAGVSRRGGLASEARDALRIDVDWFERAENCFAINKEQS